MGNWVRLPFWEGANRNSTQLESTPIGDPKAEVHKLRFGSRAGDPDQKADPDRSRHVDHTREDRARVLTLAQKKKKKGSNPLVATG